MSAMSAGFPLVGLAFPGTRDSMIPTIMTSLPQNGADHDLEVMIGGDGR